MPYKLPPLNALRAFEAAARHLSFSKAAAELHVTPAAISRHIKGLEDYLGVQLFERRNRSLSLTRAGALAVPALQEGFDKLAAAVENIRHRDDKTRLTIGTTPSFAAKWLVPRLHRFAAQHPEIDIGVAAAMSYLDEQHAASTLGDLRNGAIDFAIQFGAGRYTGCQVEKLFSVTAVALCSPRLLDGKDGLHSPHNLRRHTLIHDDTAYQGRPDWQAWLDTAGIDGVDASRGLRFNHVALALQAAIDAQGITLTLDVLADADIRAGRLAIPFPPAIPLRYGYYLLDSKIEADPKTAEIGAFRRWLLTEVKAQNDAINPD